MGLRYCLALAAVYHLQWLWTAHASAFHFKLKITARGLYDDDHGAQWVLDQGIQGRAGRLRDPVDVRCRAEALKNGAFIRRQTSTHVLSLRLYIRQLLRRLMVHAIGALHLGHNLLHHLARGEHITCQS